MKRLVILGSQPKNEQMYPHTFDVLELLSQHFKISYYSGDHRGLAFYRAISFFQKPSAFVDFMTYKRLMDQLKQIYTNHTKISQVVTNADIVIAIDDSALLSALLTRSPQTKIVYWSHDMYTPDHQMYKESWLLRSVVKQIKQRIHEVGLIIIQDHARSAVLDSLYQSHTIPKFYLPVAIHKVVQLTKRKKDSRIKVMQLGSIHAGRFSDKLVSSFLALSQQYSLILMGFVAPEISHQAKPARSKILIKEVAKSLRKMRLEVHKIDIGFIGFQEQNLNNHFYSKASGQLIEFLAQGKPVIVAGSEELGEFVELHHCGVYLSSFEALEVTLQRLETHYENYSKAATITFTKYFDLANYKDAFINKLKIL